MQLVMKFGVLLAILSGAWPSWGFLITPQELGLSRGSVTPSVVAKIHNILSTEMRPALIFAAGGQGMIEVNQPSKVKAGGAGAGDTSDISSNLLNELEDAEKQAPISSSRRIGRDVCSLEQKGEVVVSLGSLATGFFGVTALGLAMLAARVALGVLSGELDPFAEPNKSAFNVDPFVDWQWALAELNRRQYEVDNAEGGPSWTGIRLTSQDEQLESEG